MVRVIDRSASSVNAGAEVAAEAHSDETRKDKKKTKKKKRKRDSEVASDAALHGETGAASSGAASSPPVHQPPPRLQSAAHEDADSGAGAVPCTRTHGPDCNLDAIMEHAMLFRHLVACDFPKL